MRGIILTSLIATAIVLPACEKHGHGKENGATAESGKPAAAAHSEAAGGGEKWQADATTNGGIAKMQGMVDAYDPGEGVEALKEPLEKEFTLILERCTMRGWAHDELHDYLIPLKTRIDALGNGNPDVTLPDLDAYLSSYWDRFRR